MAEESIFVMQKVMTGQVQSAESKQNDREDQYAWLYNISKVFYDKLKNVLQVIEGYLNNTPIECSVETPMSFAILTETEAFESLNTIINSEAPVFVKAHQVENFVNKFVSKGSPIVKAINILKKIDPLLFYSNKDISTFKGNNIINSETWTNHIYAYPLLVSLYENDKNLFQQSDDKIISLIKNEINKLNPAYNDLKSKVINNVGNESVNSLKGSVGGLTGMIEVVKAVASGLYDLDAAVALVSDRFGISEEEARRELGTPSVIQGDAQLERVSKLT